MRTRLPIFFAPVWPTGAFDVSEPKVVAMAIIALLTGVNTWYSEEGRLSLEEVEEVYWTMVRRAAAG